MFSEYGDQVRQRRYWNEHLEYLNKQPLLGKATTMLDMQWMEDRFKDKEDRSQLCLQNKQQLPKKENVLLIFHFFRNCNKSLKNLEIAAKVLIELKKFWVRSNIPTQQDWRARKCIVDLNTKYVNVSKNIKRETQTEVSKRNSFTPDLQKLFDIGSPEVEKELHADRLLGKKKAQEDLLHALFL